jgi:hypothetical protein
MGTAPWRDRIPLSGLAVRLAAGGAPIGASDVIAAIPEAFRTVRKAE